MTVLFPYQEEGVAFLAKSKAAMLADDPGLGKTLQAIRAADATQALYVCVVCPANLVENWRREIQKYRQGDWQAFITSYDKARGIDHHKILAQKWDVMILDEGHYLKDPTAKRTLAIYGKHCSMDKSALAAKANQVWVLTGTPMPNNASELFPHLRALRPDLVMSKRTGEPWTLMQFILHYCVLRHTGFGQKITGSKNEAELNGILNEFMLRRRKAEVLPQLPPLLFGEIYVEANVDGVEHEQVEAIRKVLEEEGMEGLRRKNLELGLAELRRVTGMAKVLPAVDWIKSWLDANPVEKKLVVFAYHRTVIDRIYAELNPLAVRVYGGTKDVAAAVEKFQSDDRVRVFVGQISAAGVGITLTAASDLVFVESSWVPADISQAAQRIHRIGQDHPCLVNFMMISGSIDEDIQKAIARKVESISKIVDGENVET